MTAPTDLRERAVRWLDTFDFSFSDAEKEGLTALLTAVHDEALEEAARGCDETASKYRAFIGTTAGVRSDYDMAEALSRQAIVIRALARGTGKTKTPMTQDQKNVTIETARVVDEIVRRLRLPNPDPRVIEMAAQELEQRARDLRKKADEP